MAGYSKDIVATRKLNKKNKASLGRYGDTEIRPVDGVDSHVTLAEALDIDRRGKAAEDYTKAVGAGTINPFTGMPEFHKGDHDEETDHQTHATKTVYDDMGNPSTETDWNQPLYTMGDIQGSTSLQENIWERTNTYEGQLDYSTLSGMDEMQKTQYLTNFGLTQDDLHKY